MTQFISCLDYSNFYADLRAIDKGGEAESNFSMLIIFTLTTSVYSYSKRESGIVPSMISSLLIG
jgi:hypothetical protein